MTRDTQQPAAFRIRRARRKDAAAIAAMSAAFRAELGERTAGLTREAVLRDAFGLRPEFEILIAESGGDVSGYAVYFETYEPNHSERGLYLADLFVVPRRRSLGLGRALLACVVSESKRRNRTFVWWVALATNTAAQGFYEKLGAVTVPVMAHAAFGEVFDTLAAEAPPIHKR